MNVQAAPGRPTSRLLAWLESCLVERRPATSSLLFSLLVLPYLLLFWGLHRHVLATPGLAALYQPQALVGAQWGLVLTGAWMALVIAWSVLGEEQGTAPRPALTALAFGPVFVGFLVLAIGYGLKDTPVGLLLLVILMLGRWLFDMRTLWPALAASFVLFVGSDIAIHAGWMSYAPLLRQPVFGGGELQPWWALWTRVVFHAAALPFCVMLFFFFTTLARQRKALEQLVRTDMLTGLANRRAFMTQFEIECHRHARSGEPFCVLMCDVDHFKKVNDTWGHPVGDAVLAQLGRILRETTREHVDLAARLGGEEFAVLMPATDLEQARAMAERIAERLRGHEFEAEGRRFHVTQSVGIAQACGRGGTGGPGCEDVLKLADANLYRAKREGRDCVIGSLAAA
jgi:diguanylate cyclase (GGDEF)-like protein